MAEINLLQKNQQERPSFSLEEHKSTALYIVLALLVLELLIYGGFYFLNTRVQTEIQAVQARNAEIDDQVKQNDQKRLEAIAFQARLVNLKSLLSTHLVWSAVFAELESVTYKLASFTDLQVKDSGNTIVISGTAPSYTDLAKVILGLQTSPKIQSVNLLSSNQSQTTGLGYSFGLEVIYDPNLLLQK